MYEERKCPECGEVFTDGRDYCPWCVEKLKRVTDLPMKNEKRYAEKIAACGDDPVLVCAFIEEYVLPCYEMRVGCNDMSCEACNVVYEHWLESEV